MGMDDQYRQMQRFTTVLESFNDMLNASLQELQRAQEVVAPLWQDDARQNHDREWIALQGLVNQYLMSDGPRYVEFLRSKLHYLERYLHG